MGSDETRRRFRNIKSGKAHHLPQEIVEQILSRLPVKSLLRFRCVSQSWRSLIDSKRFIKSHLENSKRNTNLTHHRIILNSVLRHGSFKHFSLHSLLMNEPVVDRSVIDYPLGGPCYHLRFVGCCNGLVCIICNETIFLLWNPSTRMTKQLPAVDNTLKQFEIKKYGFGFDEASDDYKVLGIVGGDDGDKSTVKVYSLKSDSWKTLENGDGYIFSGAGKLVNGMLHWIRWLDSDTGWCIQSFDLEREVFGIVAQPFYLEGDLEGDFYPFIQVLDSCLGLICDYDKIELDIWVLKQYGVKESWSKLGSVAYPDMPGTGSPMTPIYIGPNKEILCACGSILVIYCSEDNRFSRPEMVYDAFHEANIYNESLVSLLPDGEGE